MRKDKYNSSGSGPKPRLGVGKTRTTARPGFGQHKPAGAGAVASVNGKVARPGGVTKAPKGGGSGSIARPGGAQGISK